MNSENGFYYMLLKMAFWVSAILAPLAPVMGTMVLLIVVDFITGLWASLIKRPAGQKWYYTIKSRKIYSTLSKFFIYNMVIMSSYFIELHIVPEVPWLKVVAGFIAITEMKSIFENFHRIYGIDIWDQLKSLLERKGVKQ
jgi:phage-related holin